MDTPPPPLLGHLIGPGRQIANHFPPAHCKGGGGVRWGAHKELSTRKKKQPILNDMGQLHYMLAESVISVPCQICYWTSVGQLCEKTEELYNRMSVVWCISAFVHAYVLFCIHVACRMWQFSLCGWGL